MVKELVRQLLNGSGQEIRTVVNRDDLGCGKDSLVPLTR